MNDYPQKEVPTTPPSAPDAIDLNRYGDTTASTVELNFTHPPAEDFNGVRIDPATGRLIPTAYNVVETFETHVSPTRWVYICTTGCDTNLGTYDAPFRTLTRAMQVVQPGTAVRIKPGDYRAPDLMGCWFKHIHGTAENPIWIGGIPGMERPVLSEITVSRGSYVIIHDLEIHGLGDSLKHGIHIHEGDSRSDAESTHHFVIRNNYLHNITNSPFKVAWVYHAWYFDNEIGDGNPMRQSGDMDHVGVHYINVAYNYIWDGVGTGISFKGASTNCNIYGNLIINGGHMGAHMGQTTGRPYFLPAFEPGVTTEAQNIRTFSNIFIGGIAPVAFSSSRSNYAVNNTCVLPQKYLVRILNQNDDPDWYMGGAPSEGTIANNIFYFDSLPGEHFNVSPNTPVDTFVVENNLFFHAENPGYLPLPPEFIRTCSIAPNNINNSILQDPLFADDTYIIAAMAAGGRDMAQRKSMLAKIRPEHLALTAGSPAVGAGTITPAGNLTQDLSFVTHDFFGKPFAHRRSVGAIEFYSE